MLRQLIKNTVRRRVFSCTALSCSKSNRSDVKEEIDFIKSPVLQHQDTVPTSSHQNVLKTVTETPFVELPSQTVGSKVPPEFAEYIDSLGPPLPVAFNLAAYINESESLQKLVQLGVDLSAFDRHAEKAKYILKLDFERDMKAHIVFLHNCGVEADQLGKFIKKNPYIFKESLQNLEIRINYLKSKKFTDAAISRIISANPNFLNQDTKEVDTRLGFFQKQFWLSGNEVRYLIARGPLLVTYNFKMLREKLFTMKEEFGFDTEEMKIILLKKPKIWMLDRTSLKERFNILHNIMGIPHKLLLQFPDILLTRPFILKQRHQYLVRLKRAQYDPSEPSYVSLKDFCTTSDSVFCELCAKTSVTEFNDFLKTL